MNKRDLQAQYADMFDASDVSVEIVETKRANKINILLTKESGRFNLLIIWLSLEMMCEKMRNEIGVMEETDGEH